MHRLVCWSFVGLERAAAKLHINTSVSDQDQISVCTPLISVMYQTQNQHASDVRGCVSSLQSFFIV